MHPFSQVANIVRERSILIFPLLLLLFQPSEWRVTTMSLLVIVCIFKYQKIRNQLITISNYLVGQLYASKTNILTPEIPWYSNVFTQLIQLFSFSHYMILKGSQDVVFGSRHIRRSTYEWLIWGRIRWHGKNVWVESGFDPLQLEC